MNAIATALTAPGAPYEYTSALVQTHNGEHECKVFKHAAPFLSALYKHLDQFAERELAVYEGRRLTYQDALTQAASLARHLQEEFGVTQGTRVAIVMRNCPEWLVAFVAVTSLGGVAALVNSRGSEDETNYAIASTNCEVTLADNKTIATFQSKRALTPSNIVFDVGQPFSALDSNGKAVKLNPTAELPITESSADDVAVILYTSGTTGRPKGALLSHRGLLNALKANEFSGALIGATIAEKMGIDLQTLAANQPPAATLLMFPLFHVSGCYSVFLANLIRGGKLVMMSRWDADIALEWIETERITSFYGVPTMYWDILNHSNLAACNLSSLVSMSVAGQATPKSLLTQIANAFPQAMIGAGYGMTETNGVISMTHGEEYLSNPDSVGRPLSIAQVKIVGEDTLECAAEQPGEIWIRGATVMLGYDNQPEANQSAFEGGWFRTGDVGYKDSAGKLYIVDRLTEMVISSGENIYCAEVERVLSQVSGVVECTTFGVPDDRLGERLIAMARSADGQALDEGEVMLALTKSLASYKVPAELILINQELERNATGKVLKNKAKQRYQQLQESKV